MIGEIEQLFTLDFKTVIIGILLIIVVWPKLGKSWAGFWDFIGFEPKSLRKEREQKYEETSGRYVQTIMDTRISGLNNYYIGSTLDGTESDEKASEYNNNFKYIVAGQSSGTSLIIEAISAPTIDLSVKICKM